MPKTTFARHCVLCSVPLIQPVQLGPMLTTPRGLGFSLEMLPKPVSRACSPTVTTGCDEVEQFVRRRLEPIGTFSALPLESMSVESSRYAPGGVTTERAWHQRSAFQSKIAEAWTSRAWSFAGRRRRPYVVVILSVRKTPVSY